MYLHFEDWSERILLDELDRKGLRHADKIIKVMASGQDPRITLGKSALTVVSGDGAIFRSDEAYDYPGRETYTGKKLEKTLGSFSLSERGNQAVRALFRFSNQHGFCQAAMLARTEQGWLIDHPFGDIDGIEAAQRQPIREASIHLDIFFPESIAVITSVVDISNPDAILSFREGLRFQRQQRAAT